jgi:hypothetical protein
MVMEVTLFSRTFLAFSIPLLLMIVACALDSGHFFVLPPGYTSQAIINRFWTDPSLFLIFLLTF